MVNTLGERMPVRWDSGAAATPHGQLGFFAEFLAATRVFDRWVADCPLTYSSGNAPTQRDVLGTLMPGLLAGHRRYAHITALRGDAVAAQALGATRSSAKPLKLDLASTSVHEGERLWDHAVMVADAAYPLEAIGQLDRDLADSENGFDELKNQWGMTGFTTQDINRSQATARACALVYNGWTRMPGGVGGRGQTAPLIPIECQVPGRLLVVQACDPNHIKCDYLP
ncbi:hypothetical protein [Hydrogenophaga sp.]|uniref:hypothetical protein n=1 Tax=Hydrogenophaga sp. TaxID=1904254 RepID=UPI002735FF24|nr:hypothetical protein [Hydrogenophaga sp.]MDP3476539.1 hypothetical protein [Hydrogenophaga sp.]